MTTFVADEAFIVPLPADGSDDYIFLYGLLAAQTFRRCTARVAMKTPGKAIFLDKWGLGIEWLY